MRHILSILAETESMALPLSPPTHLPAPSGGRERSELRGIVIGARPPEWGDRAAFSGGD